MKKKYHNYTVKLKRGKFQASVLHDRVEAFDKWIHSVPGVAKVEEIKPVYAHSGQPEKGSKIALARQKANLTQTQAADLLGVEVRTYQRWEYREQVPSMENLARIGEIFGVDWTTLVE